MDEFYEKKLRALEDQLTQNGSVYRGLQREHDLLNSQIYALKEENQALRANLDRITKSKKWRLIMKFAKCGSHANRFRKFFKF